MNGPIVAAGVLGLSLLAGCARWSVVADRYYVVGATEALELASQAEAIVDLRPPDVFERGHVPGAVSIPVNQLWFRIPELPSDYDALILAYDDEPARQTRAGEMLKREGYYRVHFIGGGYRAWLAAGGAASRSPAPEPVFRDGARW